MTDVQYVSGVLWSLWTDDGPATTLEAAKEMAAELSNVLRPTEADDAELGLWLCDTHPDTFETLRLCGWVGLENGETSAEAEWPL